MGLLCFYNIEKIHSLRGREMHFLELELKFSSYSSFSPGIFLSREPKRLDGSLQGREAAPRLEERTSEARPRQVWWPFCLLVHDRCKGGSSPSEQRQAY